MNFRLFIFAIGINLLSLLPARASSMWLPVSDRQVKTALSYHQVDLPYFWEHNVLPALTADDQRELNRLADEGSDQLSDPLQKHLLAALASVHHQLNLHIPARLVRLKEAVGEYFTLRSFKQRLVRHDPYILTCPSTPLCTLTDAEGSHFRGYTFIAQNDPRFQLVEGQPFHSKKLLPPPVQFLLLKTLFCFYLYSSEALVIEPLSNYTFSQGALQLYSNHH